MQTLFILEFQANNDGTCTATAPAWLHGRNGLHHRIFQQVRFGSRFLLRHAYRGDRRQRRRRVERLQADAEARAC